MLRWLCIILVGLLVAVSLVEYVAGWTPLEQLSALVAWQRPEGGGPLAGRGRTVIRVGVASWQMEEFPWEAAIARYEKAHGGAVKIRVAALPEGTLNSVLLSWAKSSHTEYDVIVAWADEEIHPFIDYNWNTSDPKRRSLIINVRDYLTPEQLDSFMPAMLGGCARKDPQTGQMNIYELPWMGEVLALNYNKQFLKQRGIETPPRTWEEVEEACRKLAGLEYEGVPVAPLAMNFAQTIFFAQNCYVPMLAAYKKGKGILDAAGRLDVSSPEAVRVFETLKAWHKAGYISPNCMVNESVEQDLRVKRAAMYPHWQSRGLWAVKDHGPEVIGIAPSPGSAEAGSLICTYGGIIPKCSPVVRQAVDFCYETFCTDTHGFQTAVANGFKDGEKLKGGGKMPVTRAMYRRTDLMPGIAELAPALERGYQYPDPVNWGQSAEILVVEFQKYLAGDTPTAQAALARAQQRITQEVYRGK